MKQLRLLFLILLVSISCKENDKPKSYVTLSGLIANNDTKYITISQSNFKREINVNLDGTFQDTITVNAKSHLYTLHDGKNKKTMFMVNGDEIEVQYDYNDFDNSVVLKGRGVGFETTQYMIEKIKLNKEEGLRNFKMFYKLPKEEFETKMNSIEKKLERLLHSKKIDSTLKEREKAQNDRLMSFIRKNYAKNHKNLVKYIKGTVSPKFSNYENIKGGTTSLDDFKGKYVYIDVWATWCGPCKREIPQLKKITEKYKDKNIVFVSISVDNGRGYKNDAAKAKEAWRKMISDKNMSGVQLYADKSWGSDFMKAYSVRSIPRFILIDPKGNIVDANVYRPSNPELQILLDKLLL